LMPYLQVVNSFVPDSLIAARVPLICNQGTPLWASQGFTGASLTVNGIVGNGLTTYFNPGIVASTAFPSAASAGVTLYFSAVSGSTAYDFGYGNNSGSDTFNLSEYYSGNSVVWCWNTTAGQGALSVAAVGAGFLSSSRTSASAINLYYAKSSTAFASVASGAGTGGAPSANLLFIGCLNAYQLGGPFNYSSNRYSFFALHGGLTAGQTHSLYNRVQSLRGMLGGGFV